MAAGIHEYSHWSQIELTSTQLSRICQITLVTSEYMTPLIELSTIHCHSIQADATIIIALITVANAKLNACGCSRQYFTIAKHNPQSYHGDIQKWVPLPPKSGTLGPHFHGEMGPQIPIFITFQGSPGPHFDRKLGTCSWKMGTPVKSCTFVHWLDSSASLLYPFAYTTYEYIPIKSHTSAQ